jgi:hypothetical protein
MWKRSRDPTKDLRPRPATLKVRSSQKRPTRDLHRVLGVLGAAFAVMQRQDRGPITNLRHVEPTIKVWPGPGCLPHRWATYCALRAYPRLVERPNRGLIRGGRGTSTKTVQIAKSIANDVERVRPDYPLRAGVNGMERRKSRSRGENALPR